jgi:hypothetical protein
MPMGVVDDSVLQRELDNCRTSENAEVVEMPHKGRSQGDNNVPDSLRKIIGETSEIEGRAEALNLARSFGISSSSVSAYANGSTSTKSYHSREASILEHINRRKLNITQKATRKLIGALDSITDDKLENAKLRDVASVASAMSAVIKNMEPEPSKIGEGNSGVQFIVYAPQILKEDAFPIVDLNE